MVEGNDATQDTLHEGRGVLQFILELIRSGVTALRSVITSVVDTGRNLVSALVEWVLSAISSLVSSVAQRVITDIATEV
jgi:phage-related protein